ncbi:MAG: hypothetical protein AB4042_19405, partial [Leptolyngbyaceae cyanobacterium]
MGALLLLQYSKLSLLATWFVLEFNPYPRVNCELAHREIGNTHTDEAKIKIQQGHNPFPYWHQAKVHYELALKTLTPKAFPIEYLDTIQPLLTVLLNLGDTDMATKLQGEAQDQINRWLQDDQYSPAEKRKLGLKLAQFDQFTVDTALQQQDIPRAFLQSDRSKTIGIRWLLSRRLPD